MWLALTSDFIQENPNLNSYRFATDRFKRLLIGDIFRLMRPPAIPFPLVMLSAVGAGLKIFNFKLQI
jgi:hypothetical protein